MTPDPAGMIDGPNLYTYARNNPVRFVDPWGLCADEGEDKSLLEKIQELLHDNDSIEPVPLWEDPFFLSFLLALKGYQALMGAADKTMKGMGDAFNPQARSGSQVGVDGRTLKPTKNLNRLDRGRLDAVEKSGDSTVTVDKGGRVLDGHHRLKNALDRNRPIDVIIRD